jgi:hypothetical protein
MRVSNQNYKQFTFFILILIAISASLVYFIDYWLKMKSFNIPFYIEIPSISGVYCLLFYLFNNFFWKWSIFKKFNIIVADDLNGSWKGVAKSSYDDFNNDIDVVLNIEQKATSIIVQGIFDKSKSISLNANFGKSEVDNSVALFYFFRNEPNYDAKKTMATHEGSVKLIYNKKEEALEGSYYSGRDRNNYGTIKVFRNE